MRLREINSAQVAERAGFDKSQLTKWSQGKQVSPRLARETAVALNAPILEAFIAAGYLLPEDANVEIVERPIQSLSDDELLNEVLNRMKGMRDALEAAAESSTPDEGGQAKEALVAEQSNQRGRRASIHSDVGTKAKDAGVDGTQDGKQGHDLPGA